MDKYPAADPGTRGVRVRITERDIAKGCRRRADRCAVVLAITRHVKPGHEVLVDGEMYAVDTKTPMYFKRRLPMKAERWARQFDEGQAVKPTSFWIQLPESVLRRSKAVKP